MAIARGIGRAVRRGASRISTNNAPIVPDKLSSVVNRISGRLGAHSDMNMARAVAGRGTQMAGSFNTMRQVAGDMGQLRGKLVGGSSQVRAAGRQMLRQQAGLMGGAAMAGARSAGAAAAGIGKEAWRWANSGGTRDRLIKAGALYGGASVAGRVINGGGITHNNQGERDIMGVPFF